MDLYWSRFRRGGWTNPRLLNVNTSRSWDSTPFLSKDGKTLYFASNRAKGYGGTDIYKANVNRRGRWINIQNMGPEINTSGTSYFLQLLKMVDYISHLIVTKGLEVLIFLLHQEEEEKLQL